MNMKLWKGWDLNMNNKTNECLQKINDLIECLKNDVFRSKTKLEKEKNCRNPTVPIDQTSLLLKQN